MTGGLCKLLVFVCVNMSETICIFTCFLWFRFLAKKEPYPCRVQKEMFFMPTFLGIFDSVSILCCPRLVNILTFFMLKRFLWNVSMKFSHLLVKLSPFISNNFSWKSRDFKIPLLCLLHTVCALCHSHYFIFLVCVLHLKIIIPVFIPEYSACIISFRLCTDIYQSVTVCQVPRSTSDLSPSVFGSLWLCHGRRVSSGLGTRAGVGVCTRLLHNWYFSLGHPERTCMNSFLHDVKHLAVFITLFGD